MNEKGHLYNRESKNQLFEPITHKLAIVNSKKRGKQVTNITEVSDLIGSVPIENQPDGGFETVAIVERPIVGGDGGRDIQGGPTADAFVGSNNSDIVSTTAGDDLVATGGGDDDILLGTGDDTGFCLLYTSPSPRDQA